MPIEIANAIRNYKSAVSPAAIASALAAFHARGHSSIGAADVKASALETLIESLEARRA